MTTSVTPHYQSIDPYYRNIRGFWGEVNPFYRNIRGFWGDIDPFYRNIRGFWGDIDPMYRNIRGFGTVPEYSQMGAFWENTGALWTQIDTRWATAGSPTTDIESYNAISTMLKQMTNDSASYFGPSVTSMTGKTFDAGFSDALFAKYGLNLNDPASLASLPAAERSHFFMDWYDGLMRFSGTDHVDHWMKTANWSPKLTQIQGGGTGTVIGLVDFFVANDPDIKAKTIYSGGVSTFSNGHGAAVGSLMVASHDGRDIMGIAPNAKIAAYNPFDFTGTADWQTLTDGIIAVKTQGASVVNLSLGVPGSVLDAGWNDLFRTVRIDKVKGSTTYVIAAGNDGISQTQDIEWKDALLTAFILVGSVDPTGKISEFSNRPGTACLLDKDVCKNSDKLDKSGLIMHRFVTAPGELILVSDDNGGITRMSGTSFAAPLVSGAIALLHDRWPWLKQNPMDTVQIILQSAKDMGAPGIDPVYGVGMLDVEASQSPLNFANLRYYQYSGTSTTSTERSVSEIRTAGIQSSWEADSMYFTAFEKVHNAERDFLIPLSSRLVGQSRNGEYFQDFVFSRFKTWLSKPLGLVGQDGTGRLGVKDLSDVSDLPNPWGLNVVMSARQTNPTAVLGGATSRMATALHMTAPDNSYALSFGSGDGASNIGAQDGFGLLSDYDPQLGGVNPYLGFASGGAFARAEMKVAPGLHLSLGATEQTRRRSSDLTGFAQSESRSVLSALERYKANAVNLRLDYRVGPTLALSAALTRLDEASGLLGVRSLEQGDLAGGTTSNALTLSADVTLPHGISLSASGTGARTGGSGPGAALRIADGGIVGTAYQLGVAKTGVLRRNDTLRFSVAQPLSVERGFLEYTERQVIDRETGETGMVTERFDIAPTSRRYVVDGAYSTGLLGDAAELSAFGRGEFGGANRPVDYVAGFRTRIAF